MDAPQLSPHALFHTLRDELAAVYPAGERSWSMTRRHCGNKYLCSMF